MCTLFLSLLSDIVLTHVLMFFAIFLHLVALHILKCVMEPIDTVPVLTATECGIFRWLNERWSFRVGEERSPITTTPPLSTGTMIHEADQRGACRNLLLMIANYNDVVLQTSVRPGRFVVEGLGTSPERNLRIASLIEIAGCSWRSGGNAR